MSLKKDRMDLLVLIGVLIVWGVLLWSAVRRLQQRLDPKNAPSAWTYVNELGGYFVVGVMLVIWFIVDVLKLMF